MAMDDLGKLARLYGVIPNFADVDRRQHQARPESVLAVLQALGAPAKDLSDVPTALRWRRQSLWQTVLEALTVVWRDRSGFVELRLPSSLEGRRYKWQLDYEAGGNRQAEGDLADLSARAHRIVEGATYLEKRLPLPPDLPPGYHSFHLEVEDKVFDSSIVVAPMKAYGVDDAGDRCWGVFAPVHAIHRRSSWGAGDLEDLEACVEWTARQGGRLVQLLPMLAELRELGDGPEPYAPTSKLFWDEFYLGLSDLPHLRKCAEALALVGQPAAQEQAGALRQSHQVDYAAQAALKRPVLNSLAQWYFANSDRTGLDAYCQREPLAQTFARFRAVGERQGAHWVDWPPRLRGGEIQEADYDTQAQRYYLYAQWQIDEQLKRVADQANRRDVKLCLDLPLGVRGDGFDVWQQQSLFVPQMDVGAPPDTFFRGGQNWHMPPVNPLRQREQRHRYFIATLRKHLRYGGMLRLDHVMALQRLYWIPPGASARDGVYVRYPGNEMLAILALESHRHGAVIVGENLGTVPPAVNADLERHGIHTTFVLPFHVMPQGAALSEIIPKTCVASVNTHDMPTFASFWQGLDIDEQQAAGRLTAAEAQRLRGERQDVRQALLAYLRQTGLLHGAGRQPTSVLESCLSMFGGSQARFIVVAMEDLWAETRSQNVLGTTRERGNWRQKWQYSLEELDSIPEIAKLVAALDRRGHGSSRAGPTVAASRVG